MAISLAREDGTTFRVDIGGLLRSRELRQCQQQLADAIADTTGVRLLVVLDGFEGWASDDDWQDLSFYVTTGDRIERIAIVGDERWRSGALMFAGADLRRGPVEFFPREALAHARAWLAEGAPLTARS